MLLIVDANVLFAAAIKDSKTAELLFSNNLELIAPEYIFSEFSEHKAELLERTGRTPEDFDKFMFILWDRITVMPHEELNNFISKAKEISPDPDDTQYFALALKYNCPVWSNDKRLAKQRSVTILSTKDLLKLLKL